MASNETLHLVGTVADVYGEPAEISVVTGAEGGYGDGGEAAAVYIDAPGMVLDKAAREDFQRLFMEAERQAEAGGPDGG